MEQPVSSGENSPVKQKFRRPQVALFRCSPNPYMDFSVTTSYAGPAGQGRTVEVCVDAMCLLWHMILRKAQMVIRGEKAGAGLLSSQFFAPRPITVTRISEQHVCNYETQKPKSPACRRGFLENSEQVNSFVGQDLLNNNKR